MTTTTLSKLIGKTLVERRPEDYRVDFLQGPFGKAVFDEYQRRVKADYKDNPSLNVLTYEDDLVKGSNPFAVALVNDIIRDQGLRTATQADLERILRLNALSLRGTYEDSALVLRTNGDYYKMNDYLAKDLAKQLKARRKIERPAMIALADLDLVKDKNSKYGLAFKLRKEAKLIHAPILNENSDNFSPEDIDEETGLPKKLGVGERPFYTCLNGLSRLFLGRYLYLSSDWGSLDGSGSDGLVVVVSGAAADLKRK